MKFMIEYHPDVKKDIKKLKLSKSQLDKLKVKIEDVSKNPYPKSEGGLGEPLKFDLKGKLKFRFDNDYRVVYCLIKADGVMKILILGLRTDAEVYQKAKDRT